MNARDAIKVALATQTDADTQADFVEGAMADHLKNAGHPQWKPLAVYPKSEPDVMFWLRDDGSEFPVFGRWDHREDCVWDTNDFGYTGAVVGWCHFTPPSKQS